MGKLGKRMAKFARSPKGKKMRDDVLLSLTAEGRRVRRKIDSELDDVPALAGLSAHDRSELARLLALV